MEKDIICGIYQIKNKTNYKVYIGSSKNVYVRWKQHLSMLENGKHHSNHLQNAWDKYGRNNFIFEILEKCNEDVLIDREQYYIDYSKSYQRDNGYNENPFAGKPYMTDEQRAYYANIFSETYKGEGTWCNIYTEKQIIDLINDLIIGDLSYTRLSSKHNISYYTVCSVAHHSSWSYLTQGINFPKPNKDSRENIKLCRSDVIDIVNLMMCGECNKNIAKIYNVHPKTISDIRNHKTWTELTTDIIFPKSPREKAYNNNYISNVKELRNKNISYKEIGKLLGISTSYAFALDKK